ncbi:MAG TPA: class I SAM-dependent methyltransferase [Stellaceae bacterium]|jgi:ubiquinone/menaquinone biosynthesis C-methylase UbiE|nr:class I SAM-dependent methyltransferase [Stellaceae bacterium]
MASDISMARSPAATRRDHVEETRLGIWFLGTDVWAVHVVRRALRDLLRLMPDRRTHRFPVVLDAGCGWGRALRFLKHYFHPDQLIGIDIDTALVARAKQRAAAEGLVAELRVGDVVHLDIADESIDLIFCHQTFHHLVDQERALAEFRRVLRPGGLLLFAESTRVYIESWIIRLLFRHPMEVQKSASEYLALIRSAGFEVPDTAVSCPYLWWSQPDLGIKERLRGPQPHSFDEETLLNLVARRR